MADRLYYADSYLVEFGATVLCTRAAGERQAVVLDATAFYPTSGGQPHDIGRLGDSRVEEVLEDEAGEVLHIVDVPPPRGPVRGTIDWRRRFDHMQQHTGQHILSQAFLKETGAATVSFHMGEETSTIDIAMAQPSFALMDRAEEAASRVVFEDRPVNLHLVDSGQQGALGVRKSSDREGEIRIVDVEGFDRSPCGGTHVRRTGEIGMIAVLGFERYKGGTRVEFVCGERVLRTFRKDHATLRELGRLLSAHPLETPRLVDQLRSEKTALGREIGRLQNLLLDAEARELVAATDEVDGRRIICREFPGRTVEEVRLLAQKVAACPSAVAVFAISQDPAQIVIAAETSARVDCGIALRETAARFGGRGGGKPGLAQGGGIPLADLAAWISALRERITQKQ